MTGTEFLIKTMEDWGKHGEPKAILLIYTDEANDVAVTGHECSFTQGIGLAIYAEEHIKRKLFETPPNGEWI
jgi:hypothetical protein